MSRPGDVRIGISGWTYWDWRGRFFPAGLPRRLELAYAASVFRSIEVNGTHYCLQTPDVYARWADAVPPDFVFAIKAPRFITHFKRLNDPLVPVANFLASGLLRLGPKLGPILWQFPPNFRFNREKMEAFLALLPHDSEAAARLARRHDGHIRARAWLRTDAARPVRHAVEIRHDSFRDPAFVDLLRKYGVALVCADTVSWPRLMDLTADFTYCRLHGSVVLYSSRYEAAELDRWANRVRAWSEGRPMLDGEFIGSPGPDKPRDVFFYFDNTDKTHAPEDAQALMRRLGQSPLAARSILCGEDGGAAASG